MARTWLFLKYWAPFIAWLIVIFSASTDTFSSRRTSRFIVPFLRWLKPDISDATVRTVLTVVRKGAHISEYAVLAALSWRALRKPRKDDGRGWTFKDASGAFLIATLYAMTDEFHQRFVSSRTGQWTDVLFDSSGALLGLLAVWVIGRWMKMW